MRDGPGVRRLEAGETAEIELVSSTTKKDVKGKGKAIEQSDEDEIFGVYSDGDSEAMDSADGEEEDQEDQEGKEDSEDEEVKSEDHEEE
jgi:hypothetical protein